LIKTKLWLREDVVGHRSNVYGKQGDVVTVVSECDTVYIVEGSSGRFPVKKELLSDTLIKPVKIIINKPGKK
jgi:hypothetical protein